MTLSCLTQSKNETSTMDLSPIRSEPSARIKTNYAL